MSSHLSQADTLCVTLIMLVWEIEIKWQGPIAEWLARRISVRFVMGSNPGPSPTQGCPKVINLQEDTRHFPMDWMPVTTKRLPKRRGTNLIKKGDKFSRDKVTLMYTVKRFCLKIAKAMPKILRINLWVLPLFGIVTSKCLYDSTVHRCRIPLKVSTDYAEGLWLKRFACEKPAAWVFEKSSYLQFVTPFNGFWQESMQ